MAQTRVFVIDDEPDLVELVRYNLIQHGYEVASASSGEEGLPRIRSRPPDLIVLDLMLPHLDGLEVCKTLKRDPLTAGIPILMLTARSEEADIVIGLELGADDYLTKPFSPRILLARIKAVLRRRNTAPEENRAVLTRGDITIHPGRHQVTIQGQPVQLTLSEFRILHLLARHPGWVFTRNQIIDVAQGEDMSVMVTARSVDVHIVSLRRKLGPSGVAIETIRGVGYRFRDTEE